MFGNRDRCLVEWVIMEVIWYLSVVNNLICILKIGVFNNNNWSFVFGGLDFYFFFYIWLIKIILLFVRLYLGKKKN